ncbi:FUSC family protein [Aquibacillus halophilus]|uniref:FUSC family protein n=1 Tax=Aquibacillus halophilus TaxID=930132 RepID=A0A6A8DQH0_9BACI|nr:FUSC family protein [Aquibacillus halophilus]MRH43472.1 FUSC family protein [Aquibacillus halophilus]
MKHLHIRHWIGRLLASDPGRKRFQQAGKATISLMSSVFAMLLILHIAGNELFTPAIVAGMVGLLSIMVVTDDTKKQKRVTTLLLGVSSIFGITLGSLLAGNPYFVGALMVVVIFSAFYFSKFGSRYFSLGMIGFMNVYIASFLQLSTSQFPWFYLGIFIGVVFAYLYNFIIFKDSAHILRRSMRSYHIQANLTLTILIHLIRDPINSQHRKNSLKKNVRKLNEYARNVSVDLSEQDVQEIWPGLDASQLRLYVFDTAMLVETLTDSFEQLKMADALETEELRRILAWVVKSLRDAEVLAQSYKKQNLEEAEQAVQGLRLVLTDLQDDNNQSRSWLFLVRRIESIANHVIKSAVIIQQSLLEGKNADIEFQEVEKEGTAISEDEEVGVKPTTKKAYQALAAGTVSIFVGYVISPIQPYWVILTAFIVLLGTESVGRTYIKGFQRSLGTIFGAIIGFFLARIVSGHSEIEIILLFAVVFLAFYFFTVSYTIMSLFITILIAFMYDILLGGISYHLLVARVVDTIAGAAIALVASMVILPTKTKDKVSDSFADYLTELNPFIQDYLRRFRENVNVKSLSESAFDMDQKLYAIKGSAQSLLQRPGVLSDSGVARLITVFTAINYYAKHLIASSYQKNFDYPQELEVDFKQIEETMEQNIQVLSELITGTEHQGIVHNLSKQRERIERLAPTRQEESQGDLIHHLYYVWKVNKSIVMLAVELGAEEK